jgi:soluble lytic murein transglycosylase
MKPWRACLGLLLAAASCTEPRAAVPPPVDSTARPPAGGAAPEASGSSAPASASAAPEAIAVAAGGSGTWIEAVRLERWAEAATLIDALSEAERSRPAMRYARARAALGAGDGARAAALLAGLEAELPLLAGDVIRHRAEAQLAAGPHAEAAAYFAKSTRARDLVRAAAAYEKAGDADAAIRTADRAVVAAQRAKILREETEARALRARLRQAKGADALAEPDLRWIAVRAPDTADGRSAIEALERMKKPLTPAERAQAGGAAAAAGRSKGEQLHAQAMALFRAREYPEAARVFREAAAARSGHEAEDLYQAGRALARAERDPEAIKAYREVVAKFRRSPFAERAAYQAARLELLGGRYKEAAQAYAQYLAQNPGGEHREEAAYERALALLSSGAASAAQRAFTDLGRKARPDEAGRLRELAGVAALRAGDKAGAIAIFTEVARSQPLTWASQVARARLASVGAPLPPLLEPAISRAAASALAPKLPPAPALLSSVGLDGDAESHLAAVERSAAAGYGGREGEALCGLYGLIPSRAKRRYRAGVHAVDASSLFRAPGPGERWAWECVYPQPFEGGVRALEEQHALPRGLVHAVMRQESAFDPAVVSPATAVGLMQLMPSTAQKVSAEIGLRLEDGGLTSPDVNLRLGAHYLAKLLKMFQGSMVVAAAAYNAGPRIVSHWIEGGADNELDVWVARIPYDETRNYVARVAQNLARYQWLQGGDAAVTPAPLAIPPGAKATPDAY